MAKEPKKPVTPTTPEQAKAYDTLVGKAFIRKDPTTGKALEEGKEFFWRITHTFREALEHASGFRTMFQIQKYHRNKFMTIQGLDQRGSRVDKGKDNLPWVERDPENGELIRTGERLIDAEEFTKQFAIDKSAPVPQELMSELNVFEEEGNAA